jgi:hypothetical protein
MRVVQSFRIFLVVVLFATMSGRAQEIKADEEISAVLKCFAQGYAQRDTSQIEAWCNELLFDNVEIIGTYSTNIDTREWCVGMGKAMELFRNDWLNWGDLSFNLGNPNINFDNNVAWVSLEATLTKSPQNSNGRTAEESAENFMQSIGVATPDEKKSSKLRLLETAYMSNLILYQYETGETFVWPIRISGVLQKVCGKWKFRQIHFSYPNRGFPNVRLTIN